MREAIDYLPRRAASLACEALEDTRVVILNGARQVGKSTLAERVLRQHDGGMARYLDEPGTRLAADRDPNGFLDHEGLMLIDEVQRVPELWLAIKHAVDRDPRPGRFLLTGSARLLSLSSIPDALPGRSETIELWPLSQGEIDGDDDGFVDAVFARGPQLRAKPLDLRKKDYLDRALRGGYPEAVKRTASKRRARFFDSYLADLIARDIKQVADISRIAEMRRLISLLAAQTSGLLNTARLAGELGVSRPTVASWIGLLETVFLVRRIPAWSANSTTRAVATPKVIFTDSGLAAHLTVGAVEHGALFENFVLGELARQLSWADTYARLYHYRDRDQYEVDAILENDAGEIVAIEVKSAQTVRDDDLRGLRHLKRRLGPRMIAGFVLYCGTESLGLGEGFACLPLSALWTSRSEGR
ncbi:ATP-binding protein [Nonomuraea soli]|uniref:ATP-binding protein n=1 Tax=Nonomuraea soli TaxID=1032476 RepID=A0A7W0HS48_9ACTN|nr:ATP-binding protein [Nonomuraea soli]MBA2893679.1 hypothetical protein [Nonomuraea soli]